VTLCQALLKPGHELIVARYFTTRVKRNTAAGDRQSMYINALKARGGITLDFGRFLSKRMRCRSCGFTWDKPEEKKTDVNIAVRLLEDAHADRFDVAMVVSGDSDLVPAIQSVQRLSPARKVMVAFPPKRHSSEMRRVADAAFRIPESAIRASRLPNPVVTAESVELFAPLGWMPGRTT